MANYDRNLIDSTLREAKQKIRMLWDMNLSQKIVDLSHDYVDNGYAFSSHGFATAAAVVSSAMVDLAKANFVANDCREIICTGACTHMRRAHLVDHEIFICFGCRNISDNAPAGVIRVPVSHAQVTAVLHDAAMEEGHTLPPIDVFNWPDSDEEAEAWAAFGAAFH